MVSIRQFRIILWKNFVLQKRKPCVTVFEISLPVAFAVLLVILRAVIITKDVTQPYITEKFYVIPVFTVLNPNYKFFFAPDKPAVVTFMERVSNHTLLTGIPCKDEADLLRKFEQTGTDTQNIFGGIIVEGEVPDDGILPRHLTFKIRPVTGKDDEWLTGQMYPFFQTNEPRTNDTYGGRPEYLLRGFLTMQTALVYSLIEQRNTSADLRGTNIFLNMMPYPPYHSDPFITVIQMYFPFFLMLAFILNVLQNTKNIVYEKERRLKESMKMMGLSNFVHWSAWFTKCFLYLVVAIGLFTVLCLIPVGSLHISVIGHTDPSLFFVFLLLYALSIVAFCFAISALFSKANIGAAASGIIFFVTFLPYFFLQSRYELMTTGQKIAACLLPNMGMAFGANVIGLYEGTGEGAQWYNFHLPATVDDNFSLLTAMLMLVAVSVFLFLVTWYVDAVFPGEFGVPQPWYFPVQPSYWCGVHSNTVDFHEERNIEENALTEFFEREPMGLRQGIRIKQLRKEFGSGDGKNVAVAGTNLNMYQGQITVLLGHNGAGKTTTMSMLTGFLSPTSGTAIVNGFDIRTNLSDVRKCLGLCPQHDILFDSLTVREHLEFFAKLKGYPEGLLKEEVASIIKIVGLNEKTNALSSTLSGGQKRKLSVGIALVAGSKIIILDEPTSGMDPQARREIWTILQEFKKDKTILLTTHFMDEADILGDRIAIMAEGVVKCCGTSLFLKNKYGSGYHLTLVKNAGCDVRDVTDLIVSNIPSARTDCDIGAELTYILPNDESPKFEQLFTDLQNRMESFGIASFGVSVTTMEEVFLRVGESAVDDPDMMNHLNKHELKATSTAAPVHITNGYAHDNLSFEPKEEIINGGVTDNSLRDQFSNILHFNQDLRKNTGLALGVQQFKAAVVKKMLHTWRNRTVTIVQLLLPIVFTIIALVVDITSEIIQEEPPLTLDVSEFRKNFAPYMADPSMFSDQRLASCFNETFKETSTLTNKVDYDQYDNMTSYFVDLGRRVGVSIYNREYILGASFESLNASRLELTGYFNGQLYHSVAISLTYILNTALKYFTDLSSYVTMINDPLPKNAQDKPSREIITNSFLGFTIAFCILFGMAFLASSYVLFIIREKSTQSKHIQMVCGLRHGIFWVANFTWDYINYLLPCLCLLVVFAAFGTESYTEERLGYVFLILLLYGWAILPFVYLFHFVFSTAASGFVALTVLNIFTGLVTLLAVVIMQLPDLGTEDIAEVLGWMFSVLLPNYCLGQSFLSLYTNHIFLSSCEKIDYKVTCKLLPTLPCCKDTCEVNCFAFEENYLDWNTPGIGRYLFFMGLQGFIYFALVFLVEYGVLRRIWYCIRSPAEFSAELANRGEDSDVAAERERVQQNGIHNLGTIDSLVMENVTKSYDGYVAVERLSLGIPQNECFGLLGVNGAGKTSTFKMLTGDEIISDGNAKLNGHDVKTEITKVQANLGYCPQFDALIDQLTGRETLTMFARLKGIQEKRIPSVVNELMKMLTLEQNADKLVNKYSGGNKRKLSTAISLIGDPPVIFLDEPTTGVDPAARRQLWNVLSEVRASGRTLILTSHSMEECDALCTRIAIMVNGRFLCLGSPQHLKNKFGQGYSLIARISDSAQERVLSSFKSFIETTFPSHDLVDSGNGYVNYHLTDPSISLAFIFGTLEQAKEKYSIEDYSVSQTTLQQVFVDFARKQVPPREDNSGGLCKTLCGCCCCAK